MTASETPTMRIYSSQQAVLEERVAELEQHINYLTDKMRGLENGQWTICLVWDCNNALGARLAQGFATCSDSCTARLRAHGSAIGTVPRGRRLPGPRRALPVPTVRRTIGPAPTPLLASAVPASPAAVEMRTVAILHTRTVTPTRCGHCGGSVLQDADGERACGECGR